MWPKRFQFICIWFVPRIYFGQWYLYQQWIFPVSSIIDGARIFTPRGLYFGTQRLFEDQLGETGQRLNIPPMASTTQSMNSANVTLRSKIAAHRIHFERAINQKKNVSNFSVEKSQSVCSTVLMNIGCVLLF